MAVAGRRAAPAEVGHRIPGPSSLLGHSDLEALIGGGGGGAASSQKPRGPARPQLPPEKTFGEFSELPPNYEGSYKPARMGLRKALEAGRLRNPLSMQQSGSPWSARRPLTPNGLAGVGGKVTGGAPGGGGQGRGVSAGRGRGVSQPHSGAVSRGDRGPGVLQPQRIELPSYLNTPHRRPDGEPPAPDERTRTTRQIQDLELLTFACRRASKAREEGRAHFSLGVLRDNLGLYQKAIASYTQFLRICKECNDGQGCALAYHCLAVDHQLLGGGLAKSRRQDELEERGHAAPGGSGAETVTDTTDVVRPEMLRKAIFYHNKHRESSDSVGKFVAHLNMGLAYATLGEKEAATVNHQYALRYALQLHSLEGQSLAIGSLGFSAGMYENDPEKMRILIERYVDLCDTLKQPRNQATALRKLGIIASQQGENEQSIQFFTQAIECAKAQGDREAEKDCTVRLGIAAGQAKMADHISSLLQKSIIQSNS